MLTDLYNPSFFHDASDSSPAPPETMLPQPPQPQSATCPYLDSLVPKVRRATRLECMTVLEDYHLWLT